MGFNIQQYEQAIAKNGGDNWSNATGYTKEELVSKIRTAKDSIEQWTNEYNEAQVRYDEANARNCAKDCSRKKNCNPKCDTKDVDKNYNAGVLTAKSLAISTAKANIPVWQNELDDLIEKEAIELAKTTTTTGGGTGTGTGTGGGTGTGTGTGGGTTAIKPKTKNYLIIGGAVLILGVVGFFVFRRN